MASTPTLAPWPSWYEPPARHRLYGLELVAAVSRDFGLTARVVIGDGRAAELVHARAVVARIMKDRGASYPVIARTIGRHDHSTSIHAVRMFPVYLRLNPKVGAVYERHREHEL